MQTTRESSNVKRVLDDRLLLSEALDAVAGMLRGYANRSQADKSYLGAIAQLLMQYPRQVALVAADPFKGVPRETKFLPTPADVIAFCEKRCEPLYEEAAREDRVVAQLDAREQWQTAQKDPVLMAKLDAWLNRSDPVAAELSGEKTKINEGKEARERLITQVGQDAFDALKDAPPDSSWRNVGAA